MAGRVRVYIACSLDGFIAGPGDDLSWLTAADAQAAPQSDQRAQGVDSVEATAPSAGEGAALRFEQFLADVGCLLMGRRTYDVVAGFGGTWPYGERPVLVATHRPLPPAVPTARVVRGDIASLVGLAKEAAEGKDVYVDGGELIRHAVDARLVDDLVVTFVPVLLGAGHPLFAGVVRRHQMEFLSHHPYPGGLLQVHFRPRRG